METTRKWQEDRKTELYLLALCGAVLTDSWGDPCTQPQPLYREERGWRLVEGLGLDVRKLEWKLWLCRRVSVDTATHTT